MELGNLSVRFNLLHPMHRSNVTGSFSSSNSSIYFPILHEYDAWDPDAVAKAFQADLYTYQNPFFIALILFYGIVFIVGIVGNVSVILVIVRFKHMRTLTNVFLMNLTVSDILVVCVCIPVTLGNCVYRDWIYGEIMCKITPFIQGTAIGVSVLSLLSISISRYCAINRPLTAKIIFSKRNVYLNLTGIWIISMATCSPLLVVNTVETSGFPGIFVTHICVEKWNTNKDRDVYNMFIFCILFVWPFTLMTIAYIRVGMILWNGDSRLFTESNQHRRNNVLLQRRRSVKMLICVVTLFGISWLPYYSVNIWIDQNRQSMMGTKTMSMVTEYIYPIVLLLGLSNSSVNPICYCFFSKSFRKGFIRLFCPRVIRRCGATFSIKSSADESIETAIL
ncbi:hypothetical protein ACJMK2_026629 [Sinanodonta woodiana]|uniref:G-protein coupled receptors family 1 profile domain-containing protein n=1 Tax=Sinanodonta woodiana TaxID=1069815 RepID=A0ABD3XKE1_SINWO